MREHAKHFWVALVAVMALVVVCLPAASLAQESTGSISGIVTDPTGAVIPDASVTIRFTRTGRTVTLTTSGGGGFVARALQPGIYEVKVEASGFKTGVVELTVAVGAVTSPNIELEVGSPTEIVTVTAETELQVNTVENEVYGVVTERQIDQLPFNGRNFLDLASVLPGVQIVDGGTFDPTKNQMRGISTGGRTGRVTRIQVDGIDMTDETVGTTTQNVSSDAVQEFQISQSSLDPSTSLSSTGAVNVITRSGGNEFHGSGFIFYRDEEVAAVPTVLTGDPAIDAQIKAAEFDREQVGFRVGGPFIKDKLFWFVNGEKTNQDGTTFTSPTNFPNFAQAVTTPFNENMGIARLDWNVNDNIRTFFRFTHNSNDAATGFGGSNRCCAPFSNDNNTNVLAVGADAAQGRFSHSFRYGHTSFDNAIVPVQLGLPVFTASNGIPISIALNSRRVLFTNPNRLAPQSTFQTSDQWKYDGGFAYGNHSIRYGAEVNYIQVNVFAAFFGVGPEVRGTFTEDIRNDIIARGGDPLNPLEYPVSFIIFGNGQGSFTEIANNDRPLGGINNTRFSWYLSDSWRIRPNFTLNFGVKYELDTGQVNDDLNGPGEFETILGRGQSKPTRLDKNNFGPQFGFAWDPTGSGKTVIRAGTGIFYETQIFNNSIFDRTTRLPAGLGFALAIPPFSGLDSQGRLIDAAGRPVSDIDVNSLLGQPLGAVIDQIGALHTAFQQSSAGISFDPSGPAAFSTGRTTDVGGPVFNRDYSTPYAFQLNVGIQHEFRPGVVLTADYVRNRAVHTNVVRDFNRVFAADTLDAAAAIGFRDDALTGAGFAPGLAGVDQAIAAGEDFNLFGGIGGFFGGDFPDFGTVDVINTSGFSEYNALQVRLSSRFADVGPVVKNLLLNVSYSLSRFNGLIADQDFISGTIFNDDFLNPRAFGPTALDRTHQLTVNAVIDLPGGFSVSTISSLLTARPANLRLSAVAGASDDIFFTDFDGDGTRDLLPGSERGAFGRSIGSVAELNRVISNFNSQFAGGFTPAGQALAAAGVFTADQMRALGLVVPSVPLAPESQVMNDSFIITDVRIRKRFNVLAERVQIDPFVNVYNLFNVSNFDVLDPELGGSAGQVNGTPPGDRSNKLGLGSGSFAAGLARSVEFGVRVTF